MKTIIISIFALLLFLSNPQTSRANASTSALHQAVESVNAERGEMIAAAHNLTGMKDSVFGTEREAIQGVIDEAWLVAAKAWQTVTVGDIYEKMKNRDDQLIVLHYFENSTRQYAKQVETSLPWINACLTRITTPAALAEATKVRDKMLQVRVAAEQFESGT